MDLSKIEQTADIAEIYSPERVTAEAHKFGLRPGEALDLVTGWDFNRQAHREAAKSTYKKQDRDC